MKVTINKGHVDQKEFNIDICTEGSEKQISWANDIKLNTISDFFMMLARLNFMTKEIEIRELCEKMNAISDAKFWIDNRDKSGKEIAKELRG